MGRTQTKALIESKAAIRAAITLDVLVVARKLLLLFIEHKA